MERLTLAADSIFTTIQGEGKLTGVTSVFVRLAGCNLHCTWNYNNRAIECDTAYAAYNITTRQQLTVTQIIQKIKEIRKGAKHIVITGGEPLLQATPLTELCRVLKSEGFHITIETNGTLYNDELMSYIDLYSISPKLKSSTPQNNNFATLHNQKRVNINTLGELIESATKRNKDIQFKFVVTGVKDIDEIENILSRLPLIKSENILIMPVGSDETTLTDTTNTILDVVMEKGWRYCDRLHIRLFGNTPGK